MTATIPTHVTPFERRAGEVVNVEIGYVTHDDQLPEVVAWVQAHRSIALDLETGGLSPFDDPIATLQVGYALGDAPRAYVIDVRCVSRQALAPLFDALTDPTRKILGQNLKFEYRFLRRWYGIRLARCIDTQLAELVIRCGLWTDKGAEEGEDKAEERAAYRHTSMAALCRRYLDIEIDKNKAIRTGFATTPPGKHTQAQLDYAAGDVIYPYWIWTCQRMERDERSLKSILDLEFATLPILAEAQMFGLRLDAVKWRKLWQEAETKRREALQALDNLFREVVPQTEMFDKEASRPIYPKTGEALNYDSPAQVRWALKTYCDAQQWPVEVVVSEPRLRALRLKYGAQWIEQRLEKDGVQKWGNAAAVKERRKELVEEVPLWLIPEEQYCLLMSANAEVLRLAMIRRQLPEQPVRLLLDYAAYSQRADAFGLHFLEKNVRRDTGRIHPEFHQAVTTTGRISTQPNVQNPPRDARYRECFVPAPGYKFVLADYSQIEPRLSAEVSDDPVYVSAFVDNDDIYCRVGQAMTGTYPDKKTPEGAILRQMFKTIVLALAYRMGARKLRNRLTLALEKEIMSGQIEAPTYEYTKHLLDTFLAQCNGLAAYQEKCSKLADPRKTSRPKLYDRFRQAPVTWIEAPCGRKRFFGPDAKSTYTEGPNAPIQGCSATITKAAAVLVQQVIDGTRTAEVDGASYSGFDAHIVNLIHDEIVWEVREDQAAVFARIVKDLMEAAGRFWIKRVPVIVEFPKGTKGVTDCWLKEAA